MTSKDSVFRAQLHAAIDISDAGNWTNALHEFNRLVAAYPNEAEARFERAMVLLNLNRDVAAIADLEQVLKLVPGIPEPGTGTRSRWPARADPCSQRKVKLQELQALGPEHWSADGQAWADCANYFLKARAPDRALAALDIYFEQYEEKQRGKWMYSSAPFQLRARTLLVLGRLHEALVAAERGRSLRFVRALAALGQTDPSAGRTPAPQTNSNGSL
jgi:hypothetical protein